MADERQRRLERAGAAGDPEAAAAALGERVRRGELPRERLELAAYLGDPAAARALGAAAPPTFAPSRNQGGAWRDATPHLWEQWIRGLATYAPEAPLLAAAAALRETLSVADPKLVGRLGELLELVAACAREPTAERVAPIRAASAARTLRLYGTGAAAAVEAGVAHAISWAERKSGLAASLSAAVEAANHAGEALAEAAGASSSQAPDEVFLRLHAAVQEALVPWALTPPAAPAVRKARKKAAAPIPAAVAAAEPLAAFDAPFPLEVHAEEPNGKWVLLGTTPAKKRPIAVTGKRWWVRPETPAAFRRLAGAGDALAGVVGLDLQNLAIEDADLEVLAVFPALERLELWGTKRLTDAAFPFIARLTRLEELGLHGAQRIQGAGFAELLALERLAAIDLSESLVGGVALAGLARLPSLSRLDLSRCARLADADLAPLAGAKRLLRLDLAHTAIGPAGLEHLRGHPGLRELVLRGCEQVTEDALPALASLPALAKLDLRDLRELSKPARKALKRDGLELLTGMT